MRGFFRAWAVRAAATVALLLLCTCGQRDLEVGSAALSVCISTCGVGCAALGTACYSDGLSYCNDCVASCSGAQPVGCASDAGTNTDAGDDGGTVDLCVAACGVGCAAPGSACYSDGHEYCGTCAAACHGATPVTCNTSADGGQADAGSDAGDSTADAGDVIACVHACGVGCAAPGALCFSDGKIYCGACAAACYGATQVPCPDAGP